MPSKKPTTAALHVTDLRGEVGGLRSEVQKLRVLAEQTASDVKLVAEVQGHHSKQLREITIALEPLAEMHAFFKLVAGDHEHRIKALEGRVGVPEKRAPSTGFSG